MYHKAVLLIIDSLSEESNQGRNTPAAVTQEATTIPTERTPTPEPRWEEWLRDMWEEEEEEEERVVVVEKVEEEAQEEADHQEEGSRCRKGKAETSIVERKDSMKVRNPG
jgi:hypothetical protein